MRKVTEFGKHDWAKCIKIVQNATNFAYSRATDTSAYIIKNLKEPYFRMDKKMNIDIGKTIDKNE